MPRPKKDAPQPDLSVSHKLSEGLIAKWQCPPGVPKAFLRDKEVAGHRVRVTSNGVKSFVYEAKLNGRAISKTLGRFPLLSIGEAQAKALAYAKTVKTDKKDPRDVARQKEELEAQEKANADALAAAQAAAEAAQSITVGDVWPRYMAEGKPRKKAAWKPRYRADLMKAAAPGGEPLKRGKGVTKPGHLAPLMPLKLASIDQDVIRDWYSTEAKRAPIQAGRAVAMFSGFLTWCGTRKEFRDLVRKDAARASELGDVLPASKPRTDALEVEQLAAWFSATAGLRNRHAAAYLQALVLTGARREEMATLRWADIDFQFRRMTIADKVEATRVVPLSPYLACLLDSLPRGRLADGRNNPYVFASGVTKSGENKGRTRSASGRITEPRSYHADVLSEAGLPHVSIHGLRRTFALMGEAAGAPAGAIAQIMGHRPSAISERYKPRPIGVLGQYLTQVEAFILEKAGIAFDAQAASARGLRLVANG